MPTWYRRRPISAARRSSMPRSSMRLAHIEVGFARGDDAQPRPRAVEHDPVELVCARIGQRGIDAVVLHPPLLREAGVGPADAWAVRGQLAILRQDNSYAVRIDHHGGGALHGVGERLEADPAAGVARHRPAVQPQVQVLLHAGRRQHRDHRRGELVVALIGQARRAGAHGRRPPPPAPRRAWTCRHSWHA